MRDDVVRVDHKFNDKWAILGHYMHDNVTQGYAQPELGWCWCSYNTVTSTLSNPSNSRCHQAERQINPNLLVEASINYDGNIINIINSASWRSAVRLAEEPGELRSSRSAANSLPGMDGFGNPTAWPSRLGFRAVAQRRSRTMSRRWIFRTPWASTP